jgi:hypothetical protein
VESTKTCFRETSLYEAIQAAHSNLIVKIFFRMRIAIEMRTAELRPAASHKLFIPSYPFVITQGLQSAVWAPTSLMK